MDQVSRPLLIVFAATVALLAVWLVALRPKPAGDAPPAPAAPIEAVGKANDAAAASDAANAATQAAAAAAGEGSAAPAPAPTGSAPAPAGSAPAPAPTAAQPAVPAAPATEPALAAEGASAGERRVLRAMDEDKVVVLLFHTARGADDRAVRRAVGGLDRKGGRVFVHVAPVERVGAYESITRGVTVAQSPTTLVIDRDGKARAIVGLTEPRELAQAVGDALAGR